MTEYYCIRHRERGNYLTDKTPGPSWWEGEHEKGLPRLFKTKAVAKGWITSWLKGRVVRHYNYEEEHTELTYKPRPNRSRSQLEIIPVTLSFGEPCA